MILRILLSVLRKIVIYKQGIFAPIYNILALFKKNNGIATGLRVITDDDNDTWFTLEGMKLDTKPKQQGVYIKNGKRVVIK